MAHFDAGDCLQFSQALDDLPNFTPAKQNSDDFEPVDDGELSSTKLN